MQHAAESVQQLRFDGRVVEEPPSRAGVDNALGAVGDAEALPRRFRAVAQHNDRTGTHVLFLADDIPHTVAAVVFKGLQRML